MSRTFAQVFKVLGEYFGWVMVSFYMTGDLLPSNWDDRKIVAARVNDRNPLGRYR